MLTLVLFLVGLGALVAGAAMVYGPAGLLIGGAALMMLAWFWERAA